VVRELVERESPLGSCDFSAVQTLRARSLSSPGLVDEEVRPLAYTPPRSGASRISSVTPIGGWFHWCDQMSFGQSPALNPSSNAPGTTTSP
jgi:hypothetical protein